MNVPTEYRARFPMDPRAPRSARRLVRCLDGQVVQPVIETLELLVTELVTNSVRHAGSGDSGWVALELVVDPRTVHVEVSDPGRGFDPASLPQGQEVRASGWGLFLVDQVAERWGVAHDALTRVWFELPTHAAHQTA